MSEQDTRVLLNYTTDPSKSINVFLDNSDLALRIVPNPDPSQHGNSSESIDITPNIINHLNTYDIYIIDSIKAGKYATLFALYDDMLNPIFTTFNINHHYLKTESPNSIQEYAAKIIPNVKSLYLFLSGDTSISEFVNFTILRKSEDNSFQPDISILPFPHGTGNALCHSLKLSNDLLSLKAFFTGSTHHLPVYQFGTDSELISKNPSLSKLILSNSHKKIYFLVVASWCLHSSLVYISDTPEMRSKYGSGRFRIAAQQILEKNPVFKASISFQPENKYLSFNNNTWSTDQSPTSTDLSYFLLSAVPSFEKTFNISPDSVVKNDQLHVVSIPHVDSDKILGIMNAVYDKGSHLKDPSVYYSPLNHKDSLELNISNDMDPSLSIICLDGSSWQIIGIDRKLTFSYFNQSFLHFIA